jgi:hypothetical protein
MVELDTALLARVLVQESACGSMEEALMIVQAIMQDLNDGCGSEEDDHVILVIEDSNQNGDGAGFDQPQQQQRPLLDALLLQDFLGVSPFVATTILDRFAAERISSHQSSHSSNDESVDSIVNDGESGNSCESDIDDDDDDDDCFVGPGECEMCERHVKLTRHHLIPKSTWRRIEPRLQQLVLRHSNNNSNDVSSKSENAPMNHDACPSIHWALHLIPQIERAAIDKSTSNSARRHASPNVTCSVIRQVLQHQTIDVCRPCHNQIHKTYDNLQLATEFNTLERILNDPTLFAFAKWANKQRSGASRKDHRAFVQKR